MKYVTKTLTFAITLPNTEVSAADYIYLYSNGGSGDVNTAAPVSPKLFGRLSGSNFIFSFALTVTKPGDYKFAYTVFDAIGNAGSSSAVYEEDLTAMVPATPSTLKFVNYDSTKKLLTLKTGG